MKVNSRLKSIIKWCAVIIFIVTLLKIYYELRWFDLMLGIYDVERRKKRAALISKKALMFITRRSDAEEAIKERMQDLGWTYVDTFGNGYIFSNEEEEILLRRKDYGIGYSTFEIHPGKEYRNTFTSKNNPDEA